MKHRDLAVAAVARSEKGFWHGQVAKPIARLEVGLSCDRKDVEPMRVETTAAQSGHAGLCRGMQSSGQLARAPGLSGVRCRETLHNPTYPTRND